MEAGAGVLVEARSKLEFAYHYMGRRVLKKVSAWNPATSAYQLQSETKFVYDGWTLIAELSGDNKLIRSYVWGSDVSDELEDAGGIGGLLLIDEGGNRYQTGYDGNGNVIALVNAATGALAASYEYDPFGNILKVTGDYASNNPFRFSTKYTDQESGLLYYGHRYYNPQTGKWLSKDPLEESGGVRSGQREPICLVRCSRCFERSPVHSAVNILRCDDYWKNNGKKDSNTAFRFPAVSATWR